MYSYTFSSLELAIKQPSEDAEFALINGYVHLGLARAKAMSDAQDTKRAHFRVVETLLNVMCDSLISISWRNYCSRMIQRLTPLLFEILNQRDYQMKINEINTLHSYFIEHSNCRNDNTANVKVTSSSIYQPTRK